MGATRRAWRAVERAQLKDAARRVRAMRREEIAQGEAVQAEALRMAAAAESFAQPSGLVRDEKTGEPVYAVSSELSDVE